VHGTRQMLDHCRVSLTLTLGKDVALLSAMTLALSKATVTMPPLVTTTFLCRVSSRHSAKMALLATFYQASIAKCGTWQSLCRVQYGLCRLSQALGKEPDSRSALSHSLYASMRHAHTRCQPHLTNTIPSSSEARTSACSMARQPCSTTRGSSI
jgi:hypothetical protein